jgi:hypothetical protein
VVVSEIFPITVERLPPLSGFRLIFAGSPGDQTALRRRFGGRLAHRLNQILPGTWVWAGDRVVTDTPVAPVRILMALTEDTRSLATTALESVEEEYNFLPSPALIADWVSRGPVAALDTALIDSLQTYARDIPGGRVQPDYRVQSWVIRGQPALSLSVTLQVTTSRALHIHSAELSNMQQMIGLHVWEPITRRLGEIIGVTGTVGEQRQRMMEAAGNDTLREQIRAAPADYLVLQVMVGQQTYETLSGSVQIVVTPDLGAQFDISASELSRALNPAPAERAGMVKHLADTVKSAGLIGDAFSTRSLPEAFSAVEPALSVRFANGSTRAVAFSALPGQFKRAGGAVGRDAITASVGVRVALINAIGGDVDDFVEAMRRDAQRTSSIAVDIVRERRMRVTSQSNLEAAMRLLVKESIDVLLVFLPLAAGTEHDLSEHDTVFEAVSRGVGCIVITESDMNQPEAMPALLMGLLARAGHIPYVLDEPLQGIDRVVGLQLARVRQREQDIWHGFSRIFRADGHFLEARVFTANTDRGQDPPLTMMQALLPDAQLRRKRPLIHLDGRYRREALRSLGAWEDETENSVSLVEVSQRNVPYLYAVAKGVTTPEWGTQMQLSDEETLVYTGAEQAGGLAMPLAIRSEPPLARMQAVQSVISFCWLRYGSAGLPSEPVSLLHGDLVLAGLERGTLHVTGPVTKPFWI